MDAVRNPFAPGAGFPPPELAGRARILDNVDVALRRLGLHRPAKSTILIGLRGVGKTVLLNRIGTAAADMQYRVISAEAREGTKLVDLLVPLLRRELLTLSTFEKAKEQARYGLRVLKGLIGSVKVTSGSLDLSLSIEPEHGVADSGQLEHDLPAVLLTVGKAALAADSAVVLLLDEVQYLTSEELSALIIAIHRANQISLPILLVGAGLPQIPGMAGESKSYAERLFTYPEVGALSAEDALTAITRPIEAESASITPQALTDILELTQGYPYYIQQWAHDAWNLAAGDVITDEDVRNATPVSLAALDSDFFRTRFQRCTNSEKRYMRTLAELGPGTHRSGEVAKQMRTSTQRAAPLRDTLIKKGMIYSQQHGDIAFTVPMFDSYMRRVMPTLPP